MCGIIGFYCRLNCGYEEYIKYIKLLSNLFKESKIRGLHSFGLSYINRNKIYTKKSNNFEIINDEIKRISNSKNIPKHSRFILRPNMIIGHTRYATIDGDINNIDNMQPTHCYPQISHVFNGVITMKEKKEYEKEYNMQFITDNDGEIIVRHILDGGNVKKFVNDNLCAYAGIYIYNDKMFVYRNMRRPMYVAYNDNVVFFFSTLDIYNRSNTKKGLNIDLKILPVKNDILIDVEEFIFNSEKYTMDYVYGEKIGTDRNVYAKLK